MHYILDKLWELILMLSSQVFLRPLKREDALISWRWRNDPEVWKYTRKRPDRYITEEIELNWIDGVLSDETRRTYAICLENERYIGNVQVTDITDGEARFHIFIGEKSYWGKGIASIATAKMIDIARNDLKLKKLCLWVNLENIAARKAYLKNGFIPVDQQGNMELYL